MLKSCLQLLLNLFVKKSETDIFGALDWDKTNYSTETVTGSLAKNLTLTSPCDGHLFDRMVNTFVQSVTIATTKLVEEFSFINQALTLWPEILRSLKGK